MAYYIFNTTKLATASSFLNEQQRLLLYKIVGSPDLRANLFVLVNDFLAKHQASYLEGLLEGIRRAKTNRGYIAPGQILKVNYIVSSLLILKHMVMSP